MRAMLVLQALQALQAMLVMLVMRALLLYLARCWICGTRTPLLHP